MRAGAAKGLWVTNHAQPPPSLGAITRRPNRGRLVAVRKRRGCNSRLRCPVRPTLGFVHRRDLAGLEVFSALDTLILDKNGLASLEGAPPLPTVKTLSFNNNAVDDMTTFLDSAVDVVPSVTFMSVMRNPASPPMIQLSEEDVAAATRHRLYVVYRIPSLTFLDAAPVTAAERAEAASKGKFLATRRAASTAVAPGAASPSAEAGAEGESPKQAKKGMTAFLDIGKSTYDGKHSEGNRFIVNDDL